MEYKIILSIDVNDFLEKLKKKDKKLYLEIYKSLSKIRKNPYRAKKLSHEHKDSFRQRVKTYRIIYKIENDEIRILAIGHRKNIYDTLLLID